MDAISFETVLRFLEAGGPFGLVLAMSWLLMNTIEKKDQAMRDLYQRVLELSEKQYLATLKMEAALLSLRDTLRDILRRGCVPNPRKRNPRFFCSGSPRVEHG